MDESEILFNNMLEEKEEKCKFSEVILIKKKFSLSSFREINIYFLFVSSREKKSFIESTIIIEIQ